MRIPNTKLAGHLKKDIASAYLLLNDEPRLSLEDRDSIRAALACDERHLFLVDNRFDFDDAKVEAGSGSLFGGKALLEFICAEPLGAKDADRLVAITKTATQAGDAVIVASPELKRRGKWVDALEDTFVVVKSVDVPFSKMPGWVSARARKLGMDLEDEAAELIASMTEGNLSMAAQELDKLFIIHGGKDTIGAGMVREGLADQTRDDIQSLRESMSGGDRARSVRAVRNLKATKEPPALVLWALAEEGKALLSLIDRKNHWGLFGEHKKNLTRLSQRLRRADAEAYIAGVAKADLSVKGMDRIDPWIRFERLACAFSLMSTHNSIDRRLLS